MDEIITFRKADAQDVDRIMEIIGQAKEQMRLRGSLQWQDGYPAEGDIVRDVRKAYGYVMEQKGRVIAYGAVLFDGEPAYGEIRGRWLMDCPYVVAHRLAVADEMKKRGIATLFMRRIEDLARERKVESFRVDTNFDNHYMLRMLGNLGFAYCGEIRCAGGVRMAYEKRIETI